jgi:ABC-2 type transport system ATP-binding protein
MDILKVINLTKKFKTSTGFFAAVDNISFSLKEGEILGLLGPNGAGKTTTIQMLLGVLTPTYGEIFYFGKKLKEHREEILEQVNFSSAYTELPHRLTVRENFIFISYLYDIKNSKERLEKIVEIFKLHDLWNKVSLDLSAGQLTRINLAKAFINFPKVLLLDEPTASLDPDAAKYIREFLLSERKKFQVSIILTSHNMAEVEEVCDRVIFIDHGKIIADNTPDNLAKSIEISHVELFVKDGLKRTIEHCKKKDLRYRVVGRYIIVDVKEKLIPELLRDLMNIGVFYDEISIEKPSLEDYFLQVVKTPMNRQI